MRVTVRTIVRLGAHLSPGVSPEASPGSQGNQVELDVTADTTPSDIMRRLKLSEDRLYLVKVNGEVLPIARHGLARLQDKDELIILPKPKYG